MFKKRQISTVQEVLTSVESVEYFHYCGITADFPMLKIIEKRVFDDVQVRLQSNKDLSRRNSKDDYLLGSVIRCATGHKMHGAADNKRQLFYHRCDGRLKCDCRYLRADMADALLAWDWLVSTLDDDLIERRFQRIAQRKTEEIEINKLEVELVAREDDAGRWLDVSSGSGGAPGSVPLVKKILSSVA